MSFNTIPEYSTTAASNTDVSGVSVAEGWAAANINNSIRALLAQLKTECALLSSVSSATTTDISGAGAYTVSGTTTITGFTVVSGSRRILHFQDALTLTHNATSLILPGGADITTVAGDCLALVAVGTNQVRVVNYMRSDGTFVSWGSAATTSPATGDLIPFKDISDSNKIKFSTASDILNLVSSSSLSVRQTVLSGPVDSNGLSAFGGSPGATTLTASGTIVATAANGFGSNGNVDSTASITNPQWTGLSTNGVMYLYLTNSGGVATPGASTLAPTYQYGGSYSTTNNQFTFNISEMVGKLGDGATASQEYRVYVGEVLVAGGVVSTITWYALRGKYVGPFTATLPSGATSTSINHNIGTTEIYGPRVLELLCTTTDKGYAVGDRVINPSHNYNVNAPIPLDLTSRLAVQFPTASFGFGLPPKGGGNQSGSLTDASWSYRLMLDRGW